MGETVRALSVALRANTGQFEAGIKRAQAGLQAFARGITAIGAGASAAEKSWSGLAASLLGAFAVGGPVGLGIAAAGAGVGLIVGEIKQAEKEWAESMAAMRAETEKLARATQQSADKLFELRGGSFRVRDLERILELAREARAEAGRAGAVANARVSDIGMGVFAPAEFLRAQKAITAQERAVEASSERNRQMAFAIDDAEHFLAITVEQAQRETELLSITDERERKIRQISDEVTKMQQEITQLAGKGVVLPFGMDMSEVIDMLERLKQARIGNLAEPIEKVSRAAQFAARSVADFLSAVVVRGAEARDVLLSLAQTFLSMTIQRGANAVFGVDPPQ